MKPARSNALELLAPAGTLEAGMAAIICGADAVYIGAERFGAREGAGNSVSDIAKLCRFAHTYWARVYATVNTILRDDELPEAQRLIERLYEAGVDGLIIQDVGLLELDLPPLPLIASTQMHNSTPEKVAFLEAVGFSRVILARELTLAEIRRIRAATRVELECFVHGALCVSYSGRCLMSYAIGGRSGNRGRCAQPCRRRYCLEDRHGRHIAGPAHFLSLKDLNLSDHLEKLVTAGVHAFKIEGRLKDAAYTANITALYRRKLDQLHGSTGLRKSSSGSVTLLFSPDPAKTFNRGYSSFFLNGRTAQLASLKTSGWTGEFLGTVVSAGPQSFELATPHDLHNGDGISFFDERGEPCGTVVNRVEGSEVFPAAMTGIAPGTDVYRNHDHLFLQQIVRWPAERRIEMSFELQETLGGFLLRCCDADGNTAAAAIACEKKPAEKPEAAIATIKRQIAKLGNTPFVCRTVSIACEPVFFLPVSALNRLRRDAVAELLRVRAENRPVKQGGVLRNDVPFPDRALTYADNVLNHKAAAFYRRHCIESIELAAESGLRMNGRKVMTARYCIKYELGLCRTPGGKRESGRDPYYLVDEAGRRFRLRFDCSACRMDVFAPEEHGTADGRGVR